MLKLLDKCTLPAAIRKIALSLFLERTGKSRKLRLLEMINTLELTRVTQLQNCAAMKFVRNLSLQLSLGEIPVAVLKSCAMIPIIFVATTKLQFSY